MTQTANPNLTEQLKYLSIQSFMRATGLSQTMVYRAIKDGSLKTFKMTKSSSLRIPSSEVEKFQGIEKSPRGRKPGSKNALSKTKIIVKPEPVKPSLPMSEIVSEFRDLQFALAKFCNSLKMAAIDLSLEC